MRLCLIPITIFALAACAGGDSEPDDACVGACDDGDGHEGPITCESLATCPLHHLCLGGVCTLGQACTSNGECPADSLCNVLKEVCIPKSGCANDQGCTDAALPHCLSGVCVECTDDADCGSERTCDRASYTCKNVEKGCQRDADCANEPLGRIHCNLATRSCAACTEDAHCPGGACRPDTLSCVGCLESSHCKNPGKAFCFTDTFTCVACLKDANCPNNGRCSPVSHTCTTVRCASDTDCENQAGPHCKADTGDCVECTDHSHCGSLYWCRNYGCQSGCTGDQDCVAKFGQGQRCDQSTRECYFAECLSDADCTSSPNGRHCKLSGVPSKPLKNSCVQCTEDAHCGSDSICNTGTDKFVCEVKKCYEYADPTAYCAGIGACLDCAYTDGLCKPRQNCSYVPSNPQSNCCRGYSCNTMGKCDRNVNCLKAEDCPEHFACVNQSCEYQSCCRTACGALQYCDEQTCQCVTGCKKPGEICSMLTQNCCRPSICYVGICVGI